MLEGVELEGRRLTDLLQEEGALQNALREDATAAREVCVCSGFSGGETHIHTRGGLFVREY